MWSISKYQHQVVWSSCGERIHTFFWGHTDAKASYSLLRSLKSAGLRLSHFTHITIAHTLSQVRISAAAAGVNCSSERLRKALQAHNISFCMHKQGDSSEWKKGRESGLSFSGLVWPGCLNAKKTQNLNDSGGAEGRSDVTISICLRPIWHSLCASRFIFCQQISRVALFPAIGAASLLCHFLRSARC